mmetsp:Transcript_6287/g.10841  ORF Transcript_6287/g.10841 Transcript_6287/m.10841 type:complete len:165 (-) Transcript_6287:354-848(-)
MGAVISRPICALIGLLYPAYRSWKALNTPDHEDDKRWLTYWTVVAGVNAAEVFTDSLISWFPLYWPAKIGFYIWLQAPMTEGAMHLYNKFVHPTLKQHEDEIDKALQNPTKIAMDIASHAGKLAEQGVAVAKAAAAMSGHGKNTSPPSSPSLGPASGPSHVASV